MDKIGSYEIISNLNLVVEYYSGTIQIDDIMYLKNRICQEKEYNSNYNLIHDFREAYFEMTENDLYRHLDYLKNKKELKGRRNAAYLTNKPNEVIFTTLFSIMIKNKKLNPKSENLLINPKTFTTIEALIYWLKDIRLNKELLNQIINKLKFNSMNIFEKDKNFTQKNSLLNI